MQGQCQGLLEGESERMQAHDEPKPQPPRIATPLHIKMGVFRALHQDLQDHKTCWTASRTWRGGSRLPGIEWTLGTTADRPSMPTIAYLPHISQTTCRLYSSYRRLTHRRLQARTDGSIACPLQHVDELRLQRRYPNSVEFHVGGGGLEKGTSRRVRRTAQPVHGIWRVCIENWLLNVGSGDGGILVDWLGGRTKITVVWFIMKRRGLPLEWEYLLLDVVIATRLYPVLLGGFNCASIELSNMFRLL